jgi:5-methylcytosine-specific restriction endonuclease McrA
MIHINVMTRLLRLTLSNRRFAERHRVDERKRHEAYRKADPEKIKQQQRVYDQKRRPKRGKSNTKKRVHTAADRAASRRYYAKHPEVYRASKQRRRARKRGSGGSYTAAEWAALKRQYGHRCVGCWKTEVELKALGRTLTPDHIIPISQGGMNIIENIQPLCHGTGGCNNFKGARYLDYLVAY